MAVARRHHATRRRSLLLCAVVLAWLATLVPAGQGAFAQSGIDDPLRARLQDVLDQARPAEPVPGISAAIETPESLWTGVTGKSSLDPRRPVAADTPFSIGSVTKTFVAAVILQLREEGKLSLSDHLSRWETKVPERVPDHGPPAAVAHQRGPGHVVGPALHATGRRVDRCMSGPTRRSGR